MSGSEALKVRECLKTLDRTDRYVVLMYFADELTAPEIALVLDIATKRVVDTLEAFRKRIALSLSPQDHRSDAKAFVSQWLTSSRSALV